MAGTYEEFAKFIRGDLRSVYKPLNRDKNEIRRVMLFGEKQRSADIECSMETYSLDTVDEEGAVAYTALSYAWGDPHDIEYIWIKNFSDANTWQLFPITKNLCDFLRHARRKRQSIWLWADQICINQGDNEEKSSQIRLMGKIFQRASSVCCWLGKVNNATYLAVRLLEIITAGPESYNLIKEDHLRAILELLNRSWWSRLWVAQEVILARSVTLVCGKYNIPLLDLMSAWDPFHLQGKFAARLDLEGNGIDLERFDSWLVENVAGRLTMVTRFMRTAIHDSVDNLPLALDCLRGLECSDPRDKVYGALGIYAEFANSIRVDYSASLREVYTWAAIDIIRQSRSLDLITLATIPSVQLRHPETPSWVPDWRAPEEGPQGKGWRMALAGYQFSLGGLRLHESRLFNACGSLALNCTLVDGFTLRTDAIILDEITVLGAQGCTFDNQPSRESFEPWSKSLEQWAKSVQFDSYQLYPRGPSNHEAFLSTISRDMQEEDGSLVRMTEETHARISMDRLVPFSDYNADDEVKDTKDFRLFHSNRFYSSMVNVRLCRFSKGYVSQVPESAELGDVVCILGGARLPYLLRHIEDNEHTSTDDIDKPTKVFRLIGPCFVFGAMDGEAVVEDHCVESIDLV
ncbi:MAG: hypothetical protein Q9165_007513 [Trypethelium subeluteriae]